MATRMKLKLRHVLFLVILVAGIVPLVVTTLALVNPNYEILKTQEQTDLTRTAERVSRRIDDELGRTRRELELLGQALVAQSELGQGAGTGGPRDLPAIFRPSWVTPFLDGFAGQHTDWLALVVMDSSGQGPNFVQETLPVPVLQAITEGFTDVAASGTTAYRFVLLSEAQGPAVVLAVPVMGPRSGELELVLQAVLQPRQLLQDLGPGSRSDDELTMLVDRRGLPIWSSGASPDVERALRDSPVMRGFRQRPMALTEVYSAEIGGSQQDLIGIVSPIGETGWGVVVQKSASAAFVTARRILWTVLISSGVSLLLALALAYVAASWIGQPVQRLARTTHAIAEGDFKSRVETKDLRFELADLAADFNAMGGYLQSYFEKLQHAAQVNRELFIGSLRAFTAAIDAKDPYTRGHSERVAMMSRNIARQMGQSEDFQNRLWIAALMHDVGKIGVEDRILCKGGVLTAEEYEQMKLHTVIGAEIMAPIEALKEAIPVIRWHHECWNGRGYPDGLKGEQIPLMARIVGVADTFDAITTNRPYQKAYDLEYAVETITKLTGARFDAKIVTAFLRAVDKGEYPSTVRTRAQRQAETPKIAAVQ
jgi:HD-GYP domain-containing protein (c-di-GMP phosphodiesterase class II)